MNSETTQTAQARAQLLKEWLTPLDLEKEFDIKISTQNKMRMARTLPYSKIGKYVRYKRSDINQMFEDAKVV